MVVVFLIISSIVVITYLALSVLLASNLVADKTEACPQFLFVSVVVAAKNEARFLPACLSSLVNLDYPKERLEIVIVNDDSQDNSEEIIRQFASTSPVIKYVNLASYQKKRPGKEGAILSGINNSRGEIIFITDADCCVPSSWIKTLLGTMTPDIGIVGGFTLLDQRGDSTSIWGKIQSLDWLFLLSMACAAARLGKPLSWVGNNLAFRRAAYDEVGGYLGIDSSLVEDFSLINAIQRKTAWRILFSTSPEAMISSYPEKTLRQFYFQRRRWATGVSKVLTFGKILMGTTIAAHTAILAIAFFYSVKLAFGFGGILLLADLFFLARALTIFCRKDLLLYFLGFEAIYFLYSLALPILSLFDRNIRWKDD
jgi:1,2-diacylglycerol 3-beta-glucosyltransferase